MLAVDAAHEGGDLPRPRARAAAAVQEIPAEDRRVVLLRDVRVHVDVIQNAAMCASTSPVTVGFVQNGSMLTSEQSGAILRQRR